MKTRYDIQSVWEKRPWAFEDVLSHVGSGWHPLVRSLIDDLFILGWDGGLIQIKEKFGGLRFYINGTNDVLRKRINEAEGESYKICEECGAQPAKIHPPHFWMKTQCDACNEKRNQTAQAAFERSVIEEEEKNGEVQ